MDYSQEKYAKLNVEPHWYAVKTRSRHENKVKDFLNQKGVENYLPLYTTVRYWSDRKKKVTIPLFSCYIFVKIALKDRLNVLQTDGVVHFITFESIPAPIPENQIEAIRQVLEKDFDVQLVENIKIGQKVEVQFGPLKGVKGIVQKKKNKLQLVITIDALNQGVSVEIGANEIKPI